MKWIKTLKSHDIGLDLPIGTKGIYYYEGRRPVTKIRDIDPFWITEDGREYTGDAGLIEIIFIPGFAVKESEQEVVLW